MKEVLLKIIRLYQIMLSPDHGLMRYHYPHGFCRFYPSCSQYAYEAIDKYGFFGGLWLGLKRILRCNPFTDPRADPIPNKPIKNS